MKQQSRGSLNRRLIMVAIVVFIPMLSVLLYTMYSLSSATSVYAQITQSITKANSLVSFKERMDYSMYLAVIDKKEFVQLGKGETTVNGIVTVNPYRCINELKEGCNELSKLATVDINRNQIVRLKNSLDSLEQSVATLKEMIDHKGTYEENMAYLDENIYMLTSLIETGINEYIRIETFHLEEVGSNLAEHNKKVYSICMFMTAMAVVLAVILTIRVLRSITQPIRQLCNLTRKVGEGDFTVKSEERDTDEIALLTHSFNSMTGKIGDLVADITRQQQNLHLMETKLLQAQINPHFLYNTLDTIVWLAEQKQTEEVVTLVTTLSDFFRTTLSKGSDFITAQEEVAHIESYLKIQQFRYQDIMDYEIEIDPAIYDYVIPKLLLQPLVENALYHGVKTKRGKSNIWIYGKKEDDKLVFLVEDNGKGMSEETLNHLRRNIMKDPSREKSESFGLVNVNFRIKHYYGEEYGLTIESEENVGTKVYVELAAKNVVEL